MKIADNFKEIRHYLRCSQKELAEKLGVKEGRVNSIENGVIKKLTPEEVEVLVGLGFNRQWVLTGDGNMLLDERKAKIADLRKIIKAKEGVTVKTNSLGEIVSIPYYKHVTASAGYGLEIYEEQPDGLYDISLSMFGINPKVAENLAIMYVSGYSMAPRLNDGDGLFVNIKETELRNEGVYVIRWGGSLLVKILQRLKNGVRLISNNPDFAAVDLIEEECDDLQLIGRVVAMFAKM